MLLIPRNLVLLSESTPVTLSTTVLSKTPLSSPICKNNYCCEISSLWKFTIETESGVAGSAYIDILVRQDSGSRDIIFTVLSMNPTAKNLHLFLPSGTSPISIEDNSES
jgi:hypothetical protein